MIVVREILNPSVIYLSLRLASPLIKLALLPVQVGGDSDPV